MSAMFLSYICAFVGGFIWEFWENTVGIRTKRNKTQDSPINSLLDVILVFFGSIMGAFTYDLWNPTDWIINIIIIGSLFAVYGIGRILMERK